MRFLFPGQRARPWEPGQAPVVTVGAGGGCWNSGRFRAQAPLQGLELHKSPCPGDPNEEGCCLAHPPPPESGPETPPMLALAIPILGALGCLLLLQGAAQGSQAKMPEVTSARMKPWRAPARYSHCSCSGSGHHLQMPALGAFTLRPACLPRKLVC